ncbi:BglG family transcription antiterminator [Streptococcus devriesei]|uniref:BglG family transcription antiterminator n=1 Tax=Streptococcus devriesei TaxID=231233 RepID=UPI0003FF8E80|nr:PTS sugar transporter subunit IIA [Streptococcus devriesei]
MALVNRWYRILDTLIAQHSVTLEDLRADLNVSMHTLQKSIEQLNDLLDADIQIRQRGNQLFLEVYDYARLEDIMAGSLRKESDFNSASKRCSYLIKQLIRSTSPLLIDDLAESIGVSRTTINKDLKQVKSLAKGYHIHIVGKPNHGLEIVGEELNLRLFYIHYVYSYFDSDTLTDETLDFLENLYSDFKIPRKTQELLTKVVSITIARIKRGKPLEDFIKYYTNEVKQSSFVEALIYHIAMAYQISLSQYEQDFLVFPLNTQFIDGLTYTQTHIKDLQALYQRLVKRIKETLLLSFDEERLFVEIHTHLKFLINRLIFRVQINDIFHGEIQQKYPLAFEMAKVAGEELKSHFGYQLEQSEMSYLALYFEMILHENEPASDGKKRKIAVVCTTGRGTANMIYRQLMRVLGHDIEIVQYSEEAFNPRADDDYFAIFTTVPLKFSNLKSPVIHITNLFDDQWLREEWQRVKHYHQKNLKTINLQFVRLLNSASYKDYLKQMADLLGANQLVDSDFSRRILEREEKQSTVFGNGIAFPHTVNQTQGKTILMLGLLENGLRVNNELVEFVFLVAIPQEVESQMESELLELYDDIFRIAGDDDLKDDLRKVKTQADFIALTRQKGIF